VLPFPASDWNDSVFRGMRQGPVVAPRAALQLYAAPHFHCYRLLPTRVGVGTILPRGKRSFEHGYPTSFNGVVFMRLAMNTTLSPVPFPTLSPTYRVTDPYAPESPKSNRVSPQSITIRT